MKKYLSIILLATSASSLAAEHSVGFDASWGVIGGELQEKSTEFHDLGTGHQVLYYQYQMNEYWGGKLGYLSGDSGDADFITDLFTDSELEYSGAMLGLTGRYPLSPGNAFFLDLNAINYELDFIVDGQTDLSESGVGYGVAIGWQYEFDSGLGIKAAYDMTQFDDNLEVLSVSLGVSYHFGG